MPNHPGPVDKPESTPGGDQPSQRKRATWVLFFSFGLAVVLLYFALRNVDWTAFWGTILHGHYGFLLLTIPITTINYYIRAIRWSIFVRSEKEVPISSVFWANMVGYMGNAFLPARAGELLRSAFLGQKSGTGTSFILATALTERTLDAVALVLIGSVSLLGQKSLSLGIANAVRLTAILCVLLLAIILVVPHQEAFFLQLSSRLPLPVGILQIVSKQISRFLVGMRCLQNWRRFSPFILLTGVIWLVDAVICMIGVRTISQTLNLGQALILLSGLGLSSAIPSTPGYVGVYQFVAVTVLVPFGFSRPQALAYILISQVLGYLSFGIWGLIGLWQINKYQQPLRANP